VKADDMTMQLLVKQNYYAFFKSAQRVGYFPEDELVHRDENSYDIAFPLHTIIEYRESVIIPPSDITEIGESDIKTILQIEAITERQNIQNGFEDGEIDRIVSTKFSELDKTKRQRCVRIAIAQKNQPPHKLKDSFIKCVNYLIKSYMAYFRDPFAHEVTLDRLASGNFIPGVQCLVIDTQTGEELYKVNQIEHGPPVLRGEWHKHPDGETQRFKSIISQGQESDPVILLQVRAQHLLLIGTYRSAIIEASAALETCVTKKIKKYMCAAGESESGIDTFLSQKYNWRFEERAKKILKVKTGMSAADIDQTVWAKVIEARDNFRHRIAHSYKEPEEQEAKETVKIFFTLIDLINKKIPDPS